MVRSFVLRAVLCIAFSDYAFAASHRPYIVEGGDVSGGGDQSVTIVSSSILALARTLAIQALDGPAEERDEKISDLDDFVEKVGQMSKEEFQESGIDFDRLGPDLLIETWKHSGQRMEWDLERELEVLKVLAGELKDENLEEDDPSALTEFLMRFHQKLNCDLERRKHLDGWDRIQDLLEPYRFRNIREKVHLTNRGSHQATG